jgi:hypothetical protein
LHYDWKLHSVVVNDNDEVIIKCCDNKSCSGEPYEDDMITWFDDELPIFCLLKIEELLLKQLSLEQVQNQ